MGPHRTSLRVLALLFAGLFFYNHSLPAEAGHKLAVIAGVGTYRTNSGLPNLGAAPTNDASNLSKVLRDQGFTVFEMTHAVARQEGQETKAPNLDYIRDQISGVLGFPNLGAEDAIIISLHGHGVQYDSLDKNGKKTPKFYFCPADATITDIKTANQLTEQNHLLPLDELYTQLEKCRASTKLLIVDACRNDPTQSSVFRAGLPSATLPKLPSPPSGIAAFFSCKENQQAVQDPKFNQGVFTLFLVKGLQGAADQPLADQPADGIVTFAELSAYVASNTYSHVYNTYQVKQSPELRGEFDLNLPLATIRRLRPLTDDVIDAWVDAGFEYGYFSDKQNYTEFKRSRENAFLPGFCFATDPQGLPRWEDLPAPPVPFGLQFYGEVIRDERPALRSQQLRGAERFANLKFLDLSGQRTNAELIQEVVRLKTLETLEMRHPHKDQFLRNDDLAPIHELTQLRTLNLYHQDKLTGEVGEHLSRLPLLEKLNLSYTTLGNGQGLEHLAECRHLRELDCMAARLTNDAGGPLSKIVTLEKLSLRANSVGDDILAQVVKLPRIEELNLEFCDITDQGLAQLSAVPKLRSLSLFGDDITENGIVILKNCQTLEELDLRYLKKVKTSRFDELGTLPNLKILRAEVPTALRPLIGFPALTELQLSGPGLKGSIRGRFDHLAALRSLSLSDLSDQDVGDLPRLPQLESLSLHKCDALTDQAVDQLRRFRRLKELELTDASQLTDASMKPLKTMRSLHRLNLSGTKVTEAGLRQLREALPDCTISGNN